ncbi:hypothetical protein [Pseudomonas sp. NPDC096950]|uniref:hypothetical protein n=1 Tax=Pseudomonas sp. NPDC096950 TaxID=3364485 RepID=UPI00383AE33B
MANNTQTPAQESRKAYLHYAFQFGQSFVREPNGAALKAEFNQKFGDDPEAFEQFNSGIREEETKRSELGMTPEQYHAHHETNIRALNDRREAIHVASLGR